MFGDKIKKIIYIEGMHCNHCSKRVEEALKKIKEVKKISISLEEKKAEVILKTEISNEIIKNVIEDIGFAVKEII